MTSVFAILAIICPTVFGQVPVVARGNQTASLRGVYEVVLTVPHHPRDPFSPGLVQIVFSQPDRTQVAVDAFFDGNRTFKARAYCRQVGTWDWRCQSQLETLHRKHGSFRVVESTLPGKLRHHPDDSHQFAFDNGQWFLHVGDTGYRYLAATEKRWQPYLDQAVKMGATKIRTWFCQGRSDVQVLFAGNRTSLNLEYWQEMDRRLAYALQHYPRLQFQLIPYGEDTEELRRYAAGDATSKLIAQYAQARFSAYPNVQWCISNDRQIVFKGRETGRKLYASTIQQIGRDMRRREPWGTLLTNHQCRFSGYSFVDAPWSDITTLEDLDQIAGTLILKYRAVSDDPVVLDEDRYETYRAPRHPRYYFRRLMWASLLSGGHATYGGYHTYESPEMAVGKAELVDVMGIQGYYEGKVTLVGANDFVYIHRFFQQANLTLVGLVPDDAFAGNNASYGKCLRNDQVCIIYLANPDNPVAEKANAAEAPAKVSLTLPNDATAKWYCPSAGTWSVPRHLQRGTQVLTSPGGGDWIVLLRFP